MADPREINVDAATFARSLTPAQRRAIELGRLSYDQFNMPSMGQTPEGGDYAGFWSNQDRGIPFGGYNTFNMPQIGEVGKDPRVGFGDSEYPGYLQTPDQAEEDDRISRELRNEFDAKDAKARGEIVQPTDIKYVPQSIPNVGPYGTATNRAKPSSGYDTGPMGGLFSQGIIPSVNPTPPSAPTSPSNKPADPVRDAIVAEILRQSQPGADTPITGYGAGGEFGANDASPGFDMGVPSPSDVAAPVAAPVATPDDEHGAVPANQFNAVDALYGDKNAPMNQFNLQTNKDQPADPALENDLADAPPAAAPPAVAPPAVKGDLDAPPTMAELAAINAQAVAKGAMNPDGTPGKGVASVTEQTIGKDNSLMSQFSPAVMADTDPNNPTNTPEGLTPSMNNVTAQSLANNATTQAQAALAVAQAQQAQDDMDNQGAPAPSSMAPSAPAAPSAPSAPGQQAATGVSGVVGQPGVSSNIGVTAQGLDGPLGVTVSPQAVADAQTAMDAALAEGLSTATGMTIGQLSDTGTPAQAAAMAAQSAAQQSGLAVSSDAEANAAVANANAVAEAQAQAANDAANGTPGPASNNDGTIGGVSVGDFGGAVSFGSDGTLGGGAVGSGGNSATGTGFGGGIGSDSAASSNSGISGNTGDNSSSSPGSGGTADGGGTSGLGQGMGADGLGGLGGSEGFGGGGNANGGF